MTNGDRDLDRGTAVAFFFETGLTATVKIFIVSLHKSLKSVAYSLMTSSERSISIN